MERQLEELSKRTNRLCKAAEELFAGIRGAAAAMKLREAAGAARLPQSDEHIVVSAVMGEDIYSEVFYDGIMETALSTQYIPGIAEAARHDFDGASQRFGKTPGGRAGKNQPTMPVRESYPSVDRLVYKEAYTGEEAPTGGRYSSKANRGTLSSQIAGPRSVDYMPEWEVTPQAGELRDSLKAADARERQHYTGLYGESSARGRAEAQQGGAEDAGEKLLDAAWSKVTPYSRDIKLIGEALAMQLHERIAAGFPMYVR